MSRSRQSLAISGALLWFCLSYVGAVLGYLAVNASAGRWLGPDHFGLFVAALVATGLMGQVGLVGSHRAGLREAARLRDAEDPESLVALRNGVRAVMLTTLPAAGAVSALGAWVFARDETPGVRLALALALFVMVTLWGQQRLWANYVRGLGYLRLAGLLDGRSGGALVAGLQALLVFLTWRLLPGSDLAGALGAVAAGYLPPVLLARHVVRKHWRDLAGPPPRLWHDLRVTVRRDWHFLSSQVAAYCNVSMEIWLAAVLLTGPDASMYSAGQRLALLLMMPLTALQVVFAPVIARSAPDPSGDRSLQHLLRTGASVATGVSAMLMLPVVLAPGLVLDLVYGPGFSDAVPVLLLLSIGYVGNVATGMAGTALSMRGREALGANLQWVGAVLRVTLGVPAALLGGLIGLTLASLTVSVFVLTVMWWGARRAVGLSTHVTLRPEISLLRRTPG